jgi:CSLREA domain-containing protein
MTARLRQRRVVKAVVGSTALVTLLALAAVVAAQLQAAPAQALTTFTVTKTADTNDGTCDADCSLREAITAANTLAGTDTVAFNIPTSDPGYMTSTATWRIQPTTALPTITDPVIIDGYTQPGASPNTNGPAWA